MMKLLGLFLSRAVHAAPASVCLEGGFIFGRQDPKDLQAHWHGTPTTGRDLVSECGGSVLQLDFSDPFNSNRNIAPPGGCSFLKRQPGGDATATGILLFRHSEALLDL